MRVKKAGVKQTAGTALFWHVTGGYLALQS